jgi:hypothetical protein
LLEGPNSDVEIDGSSILTLLFKSRMEVHGQCGKKSWRAPRDGGLARERPRDLDKTQLKPTEERYSA